MTTTEIDVTEAARRARCQEIASDIRAAKLAGATDADIRAALELLHGQVWDTDQLCADFSVTGFGAPFVVVVRKADGVRGSLEFIHAPRFYYSFQPK